VLRALLVAALIAVAGCSPLWRQGNQLANQGDYVKATQVFTDALKDDPKNNTARAGLRKYGEAAYKQLLDIAREREASEDYASSLKAYGDVITLVATLKNDDALLFTPDEHLGEERTGVRLKLLEQHYRKGMANADTGRWDDALTEFQAVAKIDASYLDLPDQLVKTWRALAERALDQRRYDDAIAAFQKAYELSSDTSHLAWASAIQAAEGRYYLREGGCRQAVDAFEAALPHVVNDPRIDEDLSTARDCAEVELVVEPFSLARGAQAPKGVDLGTLAADKLSEQLQHQGSRYVQLIDPTAARSQVLTSFRGVRYTVQGQVSRLEVARPPPTTSTVQTKGTLRDLCPGLNGYYTSKDNYCDTQVDVSYKRTERKVDMKISAAVKVVDPASGEQKLTQTHDAKAEKVAAQVSDFKRVYNGEWVPTQVAVQPDRETVALPAEILALRARPEALPSDADMVSAAAENLAVIVATDILKVVDVGRKVPPPKVLANIRKPVTDASQIELLHGDIIQQPTLPPPSATPQPTPPAPAQPDPAPVQPAPPRAIPAQPPPAPEGTNLDKANESAVGH